MSTDGKTCVPFPSRSPASATVWGVDMVLVPMVFGLGLCGGILSLMVLHRANLRKESAVYVYLAGLTVLDLITLLAVVPKTLQVRPFGIFFITYY